MIVINNLTKTFGPVKAVDDLSLKINPGINGLVGENGAGKSTLLRLIADVYEPTSGEVFVDGNRSYEVEAKRDIFFLSDEPYAPRNYTTDQVFKFYSTLFDLDRTKFLGVMSKLSLPTDRKIATFSKGMRRQFFLALALSSRSAYILLDEAFDGLDPLVLDLVKQEIIADADKKTYLLSSHNISCLERLCDNFILLSKGHCEKNDNIEHLGESFTKYQILTAEPLTKEMLEKLGLRVLSFKKVGSISNVVFNSYFDEKIINEHFKVTLCERIPIDPDELIALEMLAARKENK